MTEIVDILSKRERGKREPAEIQAVIESEGGKVLEHRQISRFVRSPFTALRVFPMLYEFRVQYGNRRGVWYVRTSGDHGPMEWAWTDDDGYESLPVEKPLACLAATVKPVGWLADTVIVGGTITLGIAICVAVYWAYF